MKPLTGRELECLHWASMGKTSWEIGAILGISERTINFHMQNASRKLRVRGRQAAITVAYQTGLLPAASIPGAPWRPNPETPLRRHRETPRPAP